jgi:hypothetical protein
MKNLSRRADDAALTSSRSRAGIPAARVAVRLVLALVVLCWMICPPPANAQHLKQTDFPDGTGSIGLPAGWKIVEGYHGTVTCTRGTDMTVRFGMPWVINFPNTMITRMSPANLVIAPLGDLPDAVRGILTRSGAPLVSMRTRSAPAALPGVPAYYLLYQFVVNGQSYTALGYFTTINPGGDSPYWNMYCSAVIAKTPIFMKSLPTMMAMWNSWRPNGHKPTAGSESAVIDETIKNSKDSFAKLNDKFDAYIRGTD